MPSFPEYGADLKSLTSCFFVCGHVKEFWFELENTAEIACESQLSSHSIECKTEIWCVSHVAGDVGPAMSGVRREGGHRGRTPRFHPGKFVHIICEVRV